MIIKTITIYNHTVVITVATTTSPLPSNPPATYRPGYREFTKGGSRQKGLRPPFAKCALQHLLCPQFYNEGLTPLG